MVFGFGTAQSETPESLIEKVKKMASKQQLAGVRTVTIWDPSGKPKTFDERVLRKGNNLRIEYPDDSPFAGQIVVESEEKRLTYFIAKNEIRESRIRPIEDQFDFGGGRRQGAVRLVFASGEEIANLRTNRIDVLAGNQKRQSLWIEPRRAVVLKRELYDNEGKAVGGYEYKRIAFLKSVEASKFSLPKDATVIRPKDDLIRLAKSLEMKPYTLDPVTGYQLMHARGGDIKGSKVLRQIFDSGKSQVSLIQVRGGEHRELSERSGRINIYPFNHNGALLVLIGEVDLDTLRRLASRIIVQQP